MGDGAEGSAGRGRGFRHGGLWLLAFEGQQLLPVDRHVPGGLDAEADFAAVDVDNGDADVIADVNLFAEFSAQDQHGVATLLRAWSWCTSCCNCTSRSPRPRWARERIVSACQAENTATATAAPGRTAPRSRPRGANRERTSGMRDSFVLPLAA